MNGLTGKLNEILADEWACVRALRRAEAACDDPGKLEVIKRVRKDCSISSVNLANVIRGLGGRPTDVPSPRFSLKLSQESLDDALDMAQSAQHRAAVPQTSGSKSRCPTQARRHSRSPSTSTLISN